jgi:hypothetical protein
MKELQWKAIEFIIDGWMNEKQHQHDVIIVVTNGCIEIAQ